MGHYSVERDYHRCVDTYFVNIHCVVHWLWKKLKCLQYLNISMKMSRHVKLAEKWLTGLRLQRVK